MSADLPDGLLEYLAVRKRDRAGQVRAFLDRLTPREGCLVREAAVMGYVLGARTHVPSTRNVTLPPDSEIVASVVSHCQYTQELYPVIGGDAREVARWIVHHQQPVRVGQLIETIAALAGCPLLEAANAVEQLIDDELFTVTEDGIREVR